MSEVIRQALADLPDRCREVFQLSRDRGLKYAEIATALGISIKTVEAQMGKALRVLRERLAPWLPEGDA
jgi:RNA polymerase sigma-70 factor (ECF subfamily)